MQDYYYLAEILSVLPYPTLVLQPYYQRKVATMALSEDQIKTGAQFYHPTLYMVRPTLAKMRLEKAAGLVLFPA